MVIIQRWLSAVMSTRAQFNQENEQCCLTWRICSSVSRAFCSSSVNKFEQSDTHRVLPRGYSLLIEEQELISSLRRRHLSLVGRASVCGRWRRSRKAEPKAGGDDGGRDGDEKTLIRAAPQASYLHISFPNRELSRVVHACQQFEAPPSFPGRDSITDSGVEYSAKTFSENVSPHRQIGEKNFCQASGAH